MFKNVGQGDTILFRWRSLDKLKIGIIDCNRYQGRNPLLEELRSIKEKFEIEFILITHGHIDHYSGIIDVLNFASSENIQILNVASTLNPVIFPYLQITLARSEKLQLVNLTETINAFHEKGLIKNIYPIFDSISQFEMGPGFILNCMFPKHQDYTKIGKIVLKYANKEISTKPDLNNIASIFRLDFSEGIILFTSDAPVHALNSLMKELNDVTCFLVQVPHHGSEKNHSNAVWSSIKKIENCPAVISC